MSLEVRPGRTFSLRSCRTRDVWEGDELADECPGSPSLHVALTIQTWLAE